MASRRGVVCVYVATLFPDPQRKALGRAVRPRVPYGNQNPWTWSTAVQVQSSSPVLYRTPQLPCARIRHLLCCKPAAFPFTPIISQLPSLLMERERRSQTKKSRFVQRFRLLKSKNAMTARLMVVRCHPHPRGVVCVFVVAVYIVDALFPCPPLFDAGPHRACMSRCVFPMRRPTLRRLWRATPLLIVPAAARRLVVACFRSRRHGGALVADVLDAFLRFRLKTLGMIHV